MRVGGAALLIVAVGLAAHLNSLPGIFVFDDLGAILNNDTIRGLRPLSRVLDPPDDGLPVTGRPITNLSFALNYAAHGPNPFGFHLVNLGIHLLNSLALFGLVRRTLLMSRLRPRWGAQALPIATAGALLWTVHPLTTTTVAYTSQRAESLASLLILTALYSFVRHVDSPHPRRWLTATAAATWMSIGVKEISYAIPLLVLAYDILLLPPTDDGKRNRHWGWHAILFCSWIPLGWLILGTGNRGGTWAGEAGYSWFEYARIQVLALARYLRLTFWPAPLVFDYGRNIPVPAWPTLLLPGALILALLAATAAACRRWPAAAIAGLVCWTVLAPSSSIVPIADPIFEHRMYLPSAALMVLAAGIVSRGGLRPLTWLTVPVVAVFAVLTYSRHGDYATPLALWQDTVDKRPDNARARGNLGELLVAHGRVDEAIPHFEAAYALTPDISLAPHNLAVALDLAGRTNETIPLYRDALRIQPRNFLARVNLAAALLATGDRDEALKEYAAAVEEVPDFADARAGYGRALAEAGRLDEALPQLRRAAELDPQHPDRQFNLGETLARAGQLDAAASAFRATLALQPDHVPALTNLANTLLLTRRIDEAITTYRRALAVKPEATTHANLGLALLLQRRHAEAKAEFEAALQLDPDHRVARAQLDRLNAATR